MSPQTKIFGGRIATQVAADIAEFGSPMAAPKFPVNIDAFKTNNTDWTDTLYGANRIMPTEFWSQKFEKNFKGRRHTQCGEPEEESRARAWDDLLMMCSDDNALDHLRSVKEEIFSKHHKLADPSTKLAKRPADEDGDMADVTMGLGNVEINSSTSEELKIGGNIPASPTLRSRFPRLFSCSPKSSETDKTTKLSRASASKPQKRLASLFGRSKRCRNDYLSEDGSTNIEAKYSLQAQCTTSPTPNARPARGYSTSSPSLAGTTQFAKVEKAKSGSGSPSASSSASNVIKAKTPGWQKRRKSSPSSSSGRRFSFPSNKKENAPFSRSANKCSAKKSSNQEVAPVFAPAHPIDPQVFVRDYAYTQSSTLDNIAGGSKSSLVASASAQVATSETVIEAIGEEAPLTTVWRSLEHPQLDDDEYGEDSDDLPESPSLKQLKSHSVTNNNDLMAECLRTPCHKNRSASSPDLSCDDKDNCAGASDENEIGLRNSFSGKFFEQSSQAHGRSTEHVDEMLNRLEVSKFPKTPSVFRQSNFSRTSLPGSPLLNNNKPRPVMSIDTPLRGSSEITESPGFMPTGSRKSSASLDVSKMLDTSPVILKLFNESEAANSNRRNSSTLNTPVKQDKTPTPSLPKLENYEDENADDSGNYSFGASFHTDIAANIEERKGDEEDMNMLPIFLDNIGCQEFEVMKPQANVAEVESDSEKVKDQPHKPDGFQEPVELSGSSDDSSKEAEAESDEIAKSVGPANNALRSSNKSFKPSEPAADSSVSSNVSFPEAASTYTAQEFDKKWPTFRDFWKYVNNTKPEDFLKEFPETEYVRKGGRKGFTIPLLHEEKRALYNSKTNRPVKVPVNLEVLKDPRRFDEYREPNARNELVVKLLDEEMRLAKEERVRYREILGSQRLTR